jgi:hypothetical protein
MELPSSGTIPGVGAFAPKSHSQREAYMPEDNTARKSSLEAGARTVREAVDRGAAATEQATRQAEQSYSSAAEGLREFNVKLLDICQANMMACMNFLSELTRVKGPTEAFELWSRHAQTHLQRLSEQWQELAALGQRISSSSTEPLTRGLDQTFKRAS